MENSIFIRVNRLQTKKTRFRGSLEEQITKYEIANFVKRTKNPVVRTGAKAVNDSFHRDAVFIVDVGDFLNAATIFFCSQRFGLEPSLDDFHSDCRADNFSANAKDV